MTVLTEIGEMLISDAQHDYFFRPSFANMTRIGSPAAIVERFAELHTSDAPRLLEGAIKAYGEVPGWLLAHINAPSFSSDAIYAGMIVMQACCKEDISSLVGELRPSKRGKRAFVFRRGSTPPSDIIVLAQSLITHGIIGKAKVRRLQRHETNAYVAEFSAFEYISAARNHFSMPRAEAEQLTMTEFQLMINNKYPEQKGFTAEEYDAVADDYMKKKARRLAKAS
ncbi:Uncharacterised protein [Serratia proteamaculans]|uniref:DUF6246 family protein n=1 Tax=Serratia proteamaculans TaxID=28151 RepID=UPI00217B1EED|nr:DUF6246 family protein [Serratia proteamaculans]CAI0728418.1 Uncharacterised protein [Serratia proteamaculans]CAI1523490.1 Uncharacterised protein [Serratia proteamaculans]